MGMEKSEVDSNPSLKFAVAVALLRAKLFPNQTESPSSSPLSVADSLRWKRKAKDRKQEIRQLKQDLKNLQDGTQHDLFPPSASCKCYFFDNLGKLTSGEAPCSEDGSHYRIDQVLHRRFLRQVRLKQRRRASAGSDIGESVIDLNVDYETQQFNTSVDFLVELCNTVNPAEINTSFANLSHQAVDFILASLKKFTKENKSGCIEGTVNSLVARLVGRMCTPSLKDDTSFSDSDVQCCVQHLLRKLGDDPYIGHRTMFAVSQRILVLADSLLFMDPFDDMFPSAHNCIFILIQLMEFLVSDYVESWMCREDNDIALFEEWLRSVVQARKALFLLENRNGLYVLYMDRVTGELARQMGRFSCIQGLSPDIFQNLFPELVTDK